MSNYNRFICIFFRKGFTYNDSTDIMLVIRVVEVSHMNKALDSMPVWIPYFCYFNLVKLLPIYPISNLLHYLQGCLLLYLTYYIIYIDFDIYVHMNLQENSK